MKSTFKFFAFILLTFISVKGLSQSNPAKIDYLEVGEAFSKIYRATQEVLNSPAGLGLNHKLESIDLCFSTSIEKTAGGGVSLVIISGAYERTSGSTQKVNYSFKRETKPQKSTGEPLYKDKTIEKFKNYLESVLKGTKGLKGDGALKLEEIEVEIEFILSKSTEGEVGFEFEPLNLDLSGSGSRNKELVHTINLKFTKL